MHGIRPRSGIFPISPIQAVTFHWANPNHKPGIPFATVTLDGTGVKDEIGSGKPAGVLKRLETWLKKNDIGSEETLGRPVTVEVMGEKAMVLTPLVRRPQFVSGSCLRWCTEFDVKLWWLDCEYDSLVMDDFKVMIWEAKS